MGILGDGGPPLGWGTRQTPQGRGGGIAKINKLINKHSYIYAYNIYIYIYIHMNIKMFILIFAFVAEGRVHPTVHIGTCFVQSVESEPGRPL